MNGAFDLVFEPVEVTSTSMTASVWYGPREQGSGSLTVTFGSGGTGSGPLTITTTSYPTAYAGQPYVPFQFDAKGGTGNDSWSWSGNTPPGMQMTTGGLMEGTPTTAMSTPYQFTVTVVDSIGDTYSGNFKLTVHPPTNAPLTITTSTLPTATAGQAYTPLQFKATGGNQQYSWAWNGNTPPGMQFTTGGLLQGTPTVANTYAFTVTVQDTSGQTNSAQFTLVVASGEIMQFTTGTNLQPGVIGSFYTLQFNVTGAANNANVTYQGTGSPSGELTGHPSAMGTFTLTVTATDTEQGVNVATVTKQFTLTITSGGLQFLTPQTLNPGTAQTIYTGQLFDVNGSPDPANVTYAVADGSNLPPGLQLSQSGSLSGTPTQPGPYSFIITATDPATGLSTSQAFSLDVACDGTGSGTNLQILGAVDNQINLGRIPQASGTSSPQYSVTFTACGGTPPYSWMTQVPSFYGLSFGASCNGQGQNCTLSGNPRGPTGGLNVFFERITLTDSAGDAPASAVVEGEIAAAAAPLAAAGPIMIPAFVGQNPPFMFDGFTAGVTGGIPPYACTPIGPASINNLTLYSEGGRCVVKGSPTAPGSYTFTVQITDAFGTTVTVTLVVQVSPAGGSPSTLSSAALRRGATGTSGRSPRRPQVSPAVSSLAPSISPGGVIDAAAGQPLLTPGGIMSVYGSNLADGVYQPTTTPLPVSLGGVEVTVNGENAALYYVSPTLINFQAPTGPVDYYPLQTVCLQIPLDPSTLLPVDCPAPGPATITVIQSGVSSAPASVPVSTSAPVVFTQSGSVAIATHANGQLITQNNPAQAGETIVLYGAGFGYPMCNIPTGFPSGIDCLANGVPQITFPDYPGLDNSANLLFAGLTPSGVGLAQFNLQLPASLPAAALASGSIRMRIGDPTTGQTFSLYLPASAAPATPTITSLSPSSVTAGSSAFALTINGSGFGSQIQVGFNNSGIAVTSVSQTQIVALVPASLITAAGTVPVVVANVGASLTYSAPFQFTIAPAASACATSPTFIPFNSVAYVSNPDALLVGSVSGVGLAAIQALPLPAAPNQQFCGTVNLGGGYTVMAYVPTAAERAGNFSAFAGLLIDPTTNQPFPGGIIPASQIGQVYAWRIPPQDFFTFGGNVIQRKNNR